MFFIDLGSFNVRRIKTNEATGLKTIALGSSYRVRWHDVRTAFHENLPMGSKIITRRYTDGQTDSTVVLQASVSFCK
jgi:hypothetical protein